MADREPKPSGAAFARWRRGQAEVLRRLQAAGHLSPSLAGWLGQHGTAFDSFTEFLAASGQPVPTLAKRKGS